MSAPTFIAWIPTIRGPLGHVVGSIDADLERRALYTMAVPPYALERIVTKPGETLEDAILRTFPYDPQRARERAA